MAKTLIAYFSRADENYFGGAMRYVKVGNTEIVVGVMKDLIEADTFKIEMKDPYSPVYMTCIEEAKKDLRAKARPELVSTRCRWLSLPSWKPLISPERLFFRSAPTKAVGWEAANGI